MSILSNLNDWHFGFHYPRTNGIDLDVVFDQLQGQRFGEHEGTAVAGAVIAAVCDGLLGRVRGDVNDLSAFLGLRGRSCF